MRTCRSRDSGTTYSPELLKRQQSITRLQRFSDRCCSAEAGADMRAVRLWSWIFFLTNLPHSRKRRSDGSGILHLRLHWHLLPYCFLLRLAISSGSCSGLLSPAISPIMQQVLRSHLRLRIIGHSANIYVQSPYF